MQKFIHPKKVQLFLVYNVLKKYSDDHNLLTYQQIIEHIKKDYGVTYDRKSIATSINLLSGDEKNTDDEGLGIGIIKTRNGCYLCDRLFEPSEINLLTDAVFSSKIICASHAKDICEKLLSTLSDHYRKNYRKPIMCSEIDRTKSHEIFATIDAITHAIRHNKMLSFNYVTYDENFNKVHKKKNGNDVYLVSPIYIIYSRGYSYLLAIPEHKSSEKGRFFTFRLDYIDNPKTDKKNRERAESVDKNFTITKYLNSHIYIGGGDKIIEAKLILKQPDSYKYIVEWFGEEHTKKSKEKGKQIVTIQCEEQTFFYWIMQYSQHFTLVGPKSLVEQVRKAAKNIIDTYKLEK